MKVYEITDISQILELRHKVEASMKATYNNIFDILRDNDPPDFFYNIKFREVGHDPLSDRSLNFIEQVNQTFTYLVSLYGAEYLLNNYSDLKPFVLNLGTAAGHDIISKDGYLIAETFAAVHVKSNDKINKDLKKLQSAENTKIKYLFFYVDRIYKDIESLRIKYADIHIVPIGKENITFNKDVFDDGVDKYILKKEV